jgi:hypothetical protein
LPLPGRNQLTAREATQSWLMSFFTSIKAKTHNARPAKQHPDALTN